MDERIGFRLYQSCGDRGVLDMCLCFGCGGVGRECVGVWTRVGSGEVGCYVCVRCESGLSV